MQSIIVGAAGSIGTALCERIAQSGGAAFLIGRTEESLQPLAERFGWHFAVADGADWSSLDAAVATGIESLGGLTSAVNLAGSIVLKPAHLTSQQDFQNAISANLMTAFGLVRATANKFNGGGSIVLASSAAGSIGLAMHEAIAACKSGIDGLVRSAAATYSSQGVRVNAVAPGLVESNMSKRIFANPKAVETSLAMHPLGRLGQPDDVAAAIEYFMSDASSWVTGQILGVDGGLGQLKLLTQTKAAK